MPASSVAPSSDRYAWDKTTAGQGNAGIAALAEFVASFPLSVRQFFCGKAVTANWTRREERPLAIRAGKSFKLNKRSLLIRE
jgi:hypothetical protein